MPVFSGSLSASCRLLWNENGVRKTNPEIIVALLSLAGTLGGSLLGCVAANKLSAYRISKLEEKVDKHNHLIERMVVVEQSTKSAHHRLDDIEKRLEE